MLFIVKRYQYNPPNSHQNGKYDTGEKIGFKYIQQVLEYASDITRSEHIGTKILDSQRHPIAVYRPQTKVGDVWEWLNADRIYWLQNNGIVR